MTLAHAWLLFGFILYSAGVFKFAKWYIFEALEENEWPPEMDFGDTCITLPLFCGGLLIVFVASTQFGIKAMTQIALFMMAYPALFLAGFFVLKAFGGYLIARIDKPRKWERTFSVAVAIFTIFYTLLLFKMLNEINFR